MYVCIIKELSPIITENTKKYVCLILRRLLFFNCDSDLVEEGSDLVREVSDLVQEGFDLVQEGSDLVQEGFDLVHKVSALVFRSYCINGCARSKYISDIVSCFPLY